MGSPHFPWQGATATPGDWEEVGRARLGQPWGGRLEGSVGHRGVSGGPREGRERNCPVGSPEGSRAGRNHRSHSYPTLTSFS